MGILLEALKEDTNILYHGSTVQNLKILNPSNITTPGDTDKKRVFAIDDKMYALCFASKMIEGEPIGVFTDKDEFYIKELIPNAFDLYKTKGSIYTVDSKFFKLMNTNGWREFYSYDQIKVLNEEKIKNVYSELINYSKEKKLNMIFYKETLYDEYYKDGRKK